MCVLAQPTKGRTGSRSIPYNICMISCYFAATKFNRLLVLRIEVETALRVQFVDSCLCCIRKPPAKTKAPQFQDTCLPTQAMLKPSARVAPKIKWWLTCKNKITNKQKRRNIYCITPRNLKIPPSRRTTPDLLCPTTETAFASGYASTS